MNKWFIYVNRHFVDIELFPCNLSEADVLEQMKVQFDTNNVQVEFYKSV